MNKLAVQSTKRLGVLYGFLAALCIALYTLINRYAYTQYGVDSFSYTATFMISGGLFGLLSMIIRGDKSLAKDKEQTSFMVLNGLIAAVAVGILVFGQRYTTAINASIILSTSTLPTALFAWLLLKEKLRRKQVPWIATLFVGLYLAIAGWQFLNFNKGDLMILITVLMLGFTNTYSKLLMKHSHNDTIADVRLVSGGVLFIVLGLALGKAIIISSAGWWPLIAGFALWAAIKTFYASVHYLSPNNAIVLANSSPMITPIAGVLLLNEPYSWVKLLGSVIILVSVYKFTKR